MNNLFEKYKQILSSGLGSLGNTLQAALERGRVGNDGTKNTPYTGGLINNPQVRALTQPLVTELKKDLPSAYTTFNSQQPLGIAKTILGDRTAQPKLSDIGNTAKLGLSAYGAYVAPAGIAVGAGLNAGMNTLKNYQEQKPLTENLASSIGSGAVNAAPYAGLFNATTPLTNEATSKLISKTASPIVARALGGITRVAEGAANTKALGGDYGVLQGALDFGQGVVGSSSSIKANLLEGRRLDPSTLKELADAESVLNQSTKDFGFGGRPSSQAQLKINQLQAQARDTIDRIAGGFLPDNVLEQVAGSPKKTLRALIDMHNSGNDIGQIHPAMNLVENAKPQTPDAVISEARQQIKPGINEKVTSLKQTARNFYTDWVNRFQPVEDVAALAEKNTNSSIRPEFNPKYQLKRLMGAGGVAELRQQKVLNPILDELGDIPKADFDVFLKAKRDLGFASIGRDIKGSDAQKAQQVVDAFSQKYDINTLNSVADKLYAYQDKSLQMLKDAGFISPESMGTIKANNPDYVPFQRVMDQVDNFLGLPTNKLAQGTNPLQKIEGSDKAILSPLESIIANTYKTEAAISKNNVAKSIVDLQKIDPSLSEVFKPLRTAENVNKRIDLYSEAKDLKPIQSDIETLINRNGKQLSTLNREVNSLENKGLKVSLQGQPVEGPAPLVSKVKVVTDPGKVNFGEGDVVTGGKLGTVKVTPIGATTTNTGAQSTKKFIESLITNPDSDIQALKKMVSNREGKMAPIIDKLESLKSAFQDVRDYRNSLTSEARTLADANLKGEQTIPVWRNGVRELYKAPEDIIRAVKGLNEEGMGTITKILSAPARLLRQGATGSNPDFMIPNVFKDQFDAAVNAKYGYTPFVDYIRGLAHLVKYERGGDTLVEDWINNGGKIFFENMSGRKAISQQVSEATGKEPLLKQLGNFVTGTFETIGNYSENPTRIGLYERALNATGNKLMAAEQSREGTLDFARMGAKMKTANAIIPFLNVGVQGFDKLIRTAKENPAAFTLRMGMYAVTPAVMASVYNNKYHPKEYAAIPQYEKDTNFILVTGSKSDGSPQYIKFPKGNVTPLIANPVDNLVTYLSGNNPQGFDSLALNLFADILPLTQGGDNLAQVASRTIGANIPEFAKPTIEGVTNYNFFKGAPIVPSYMQNKPPSEQVKPTTPDIYKYLGGVVNQSPLQVQNFAEDTLAGFAKFPLDMFNTARNAGTGNPVDVNHVPIVRRFIGTGDTPENTAKYAAYAQNDKMKQDIINKNTPPLLDRILGTKTTGAADIAGYNPSDTSKLKDVKDFPDPTTAKMQVQYSKKPATSNGVYYYQDKATGRTMSVTLDRQVTPPTPTGNAALDEQLMSKYKGEITSKKNDILKQLELGLISNSEATNKINSLTTEQPIVYPALPTLTGNKLLDTERIAKFTGALTTIKNNIIKQNQAGTLSDSEAEKQLTKISLVEKAIRAKASTKKVKSVKYKAPKTKYAKIKVSSVAKPRVYKLKKVSLKLPKIKKLKKVKLT